MFVYEIFPQETIYFKISKWIRFKLFFAKKHYGYDTEGNITTVSEFRKLKDVFYCTRSWTYQDGKLIRKEKL